LVVKARSGAEPTEPEAPMSATLAPALPTSRRALRSVAAVLAAVLANAVASTITDVVFHALDVYPAWSEPMVEVGDNLLALGYRIVIGVAGAWLAARLAPARPFRHAIAYGIVGLVLGSTAAYVTITRYDFGPDWYPILLAASALPCAWLGGRLAERRA
jgi:hypothetical protein